MNGTVRTERKEVAVIIPAFNEAHGIGAVLDAVSAIGKGSFYNIRAIVVDNNSTDDTAKISLSHGADIIKESRQGKGYAIQTGFSAISNNIDYVVMLDGDGTYKPGEIPRLLELLESGFADAVIGSRLAGHITDGSMTISHRLANWFFTFLVRHIYKANITDVCSGFFAWKTTAIEMLRKNLTSSGFTLETEMVTKMARMGLRMYSVPITYETRKGYSKISPIRDGIKILMKIIRNINWQPQNLD